MHGTHIYTNADCSEHFERMLFSCVSSTSSDHLLLRLFLFSRLYVCAFGCSAKDKFHIWLIIMQNIVQGFLLLLAGAVLFSQTCSLSCDVVVARCALTFVAILLLHGFYFFRFFIHSSLFLFHCCCRPSGHCAQIAICRLFVLAASAIFFLATQQQQRRKLPVSLFIPSVRVHTICNACMYIVYCIICVCLCVCVCFHS